MFNHMFSLSAAVRRIRLLFKQPFFWWLTIWGHGAIIGGALGIYFLERDVNDRASNFIDCLYWAVSTVTTVGYGDITPITTYGKILAMGLMILGAVFIWSYSGLFAGVLIAPELRGVEKEVLKIEKELKGSASTSHDHEVLPKEIKKELRDLIERLDELLPKH